MPTASAPERITVPYIRDLKIKQSYSPLVALTAYDYTMARLIDRAGVDIVLVGDSLASVVQGLENTIPVTLDEVIYHSRCVSKGVSRALVVGDLPFMSYQVSPERALESAGRLLKEGGVAAVKLEGGLHMAATIQRLVDVDIPVMGHIGLTPQSFHRMGGHRVQGRRSGSRSEAGSRERILKDALAVEKAGAFACVLESIPAELAAEITKILSIPTIGIGAGVNCDGQILVVSDALGMNSEFRPKFVKPYADLSSEIVSALQTYAKEVRSSQFPGPEHSFHSPRAVSGKKRQRLGVG